MATPAAIPTTMPTAPLTAAVGTAAAWDTLLDSDALEVLADSAPCELPAEETAEEIVEESAPKGAETPSPELVVVEGAAVMMLLDGKAVFELTSAVVLEATDNAVAEGELPVELAVASAPKPGRKLGEYVAVPE